MDTPLFMRFRRDGEEGVCMSLGDKFFSLPYSSMIECIYADFNSSVKEEISSVDVQVKAPIIPSKIVGIGWNYGGHTRELRHVYEKPLIFLKPSSSVVGPDDDIVLPKISGQVDHEVELGVVVGRSARGVGKGDALDYIAGYTVLVDVTARDLQWVARERGDPWSVCKGFDTFAPMGPGLVPRGYISEPNNLDIRLKINDEVRQKANTGDMIYPVEEIVSYVSGFMTLQPGDVIATGTPEGVGPLRAGDVIESWIEGVGVLRNYVVDEG